MSNPTGPLVELAGLKKHFLVGAIEVAALRGVSLSIQPGEIVALRGPSGSGKSTLLNILGLLEEPSSGTMRFEGHDVGNCTDRELTTIRRRSIGFIFQNFNLVPVLTALENVEYPLLLSGEIPPSETRKRALEMLELVGLANFGHHRPAQLSGGQRQRVAIARAIVKRPRMILADEPTANLDTQTANQVLDVMREMRGRIGTAIILATHDEAVAARAEREIHLRDGILAEEAIKRSAPAPERYSSGQS